MNTDIRQHHKNDFHLLMEISVQQQHKLFLPLIQRFPLM